MTTHNDESLKPCPMCGKSVAVVSTHKEIFGEDEYYDDSSDDTFAVFCDASMPNGPGGCGVSGGFARTEAEAIALWNRRAEQPQPAPMQVDGQLETVIKFLLGEGDLDGYWFGESKYSHSPFWWRKNLRAALASRAEHAVPEGYVIVPKKATTAMLRPFYECPPEELELAWGALLIVARNARHTSNTGE